MAKRRRKYRSRSIVYTLQKGKKEVTVGFVLTSFLVALLLIGSVGFVLKQVKDYFIVQLNQEIALLRQDILRLHSQNERLRSELPQQYNHIADIARQKFGFVETVAPPESLIVDKRQWWRFRQMDIRQQEQWHAP